MPPVFIDLTGDDDNGHQQPLAPPAPRHNQVDRYRHCAVLRGAVSVAEQEELAIVVGGFPSLDKFQHHGTYGRRTNVCSYVQDQGPLERVTQVANRCAAAFEAAGVPTAHYSTCKKLAFLRYGELRWHSDRTPGMKLVLSLLGPATLTTSASNKCPAFGRKPAGPSEEVTLFPGDAYVMDAQRYAHHVKVHGRPRIALLMRGS